MAHGSPELTLYNTLTRAKEAFAPIDANNVRIYVCGPTVYDYAHIGNARPAIVFDVLYRLLRHLHGADRVTYVRNITDVDDKINARALRDFGGDIDAGRLSLNEAIRKVTEPTYDQYQKDVAALGCLEPTFQPRATEFVLPRADGKDDMVGMIQSLIERGHAYEAKGESGREILFDTTSMADYGQLSKRNLDEQQAGARVAVEAHKKHPADFVLWKESSADEPGWDATFRVDDADVAIRGRPGWHIECSAMSAAYLGEVFDIHGGGLDLIFPHHENEIAQSRCAHGSAVMANYWMHNGFLQVEGRKMSKSEGNFVTIHDLLHTEKFGGRRWPGEVLRLAMLMTHYREPIDFSVKRLEEAANTLNRWRRWIEHSGDGSTLVTEDALEALSDDLNTPRLLNFMAEYSSDAAGVWVNTEYHNHKLVNYDERRRVGAAALRGALELLGFAHKAEADEKPILSAISQRLALIREKNWAEADKIRDELLAQGIQLKDGKDPETGERVTTWEVKR
ncbi:MAG: cysteine--tRNA ligase [Rhizobiaceae bacterium]|nr:cysteine--tRNA ligase [Rhizobiaceae bacterium]